MQVPEEPRIRRSQRDYSLPFKLTVVGEVACGELSKKQAQRRYGIQGRSTVMNWCRRYASHFVTFQTAGTTSPGAAPRCRPPVPPPGAAPRCRPPVPPPRGPDPMDPTPEQRIKQSGTALRVQKKQHEKQLKNSTDLNLLLRTMLQVMVDHGIPLPKKSFRPPFPDWRPKLGIQRSCPLCGVSRQGLYQHQALAAERAEAVLVHVRAVRTQLPRLDKRKLRHKIAPLLRAQGVASRCLVHPAAPTRAAHYAQAQLHENDGLPSPLPLPPQSGERYAQVHDSQSIVGQ